MRVDGLSRRWNVKSEAALETTLTRRDTLGGAEFWLSPPDRKYPCLAIRICGALCDMHFFPAARHPGFRCLGGEGLPADGVTKLVFEGCDPGDGEQTPNRFIVPFNKVLSVAKVFFRTGSKSDTEEWLEL